MPLKHYRRSYFIDPESFEQAELIVQAQKKMKPALYTLAISVFTRFIHDRDVDVSRGYFKFASIMGYSQADRSPQVHELWEGMAQAYGRDAAASDTIHRVLGTICMICVAKDPRKWVYVEDEDKKQKLSLDKIPDPNQYFIGKYTLPKKKR